MKRMIAGIVLFASGFIGGSVVHSYRPPSNIGEALLMIGQGKELVLKEPFYQIGMGIMGAIAISGLLLIGTSWATSHVSTNSNAAWGKSTAAIRTNRQETVRAMIDFPWGRVEVKDRLSVGRDREFSPLAAKLADNMHVSRRHAELFMKNGVLYVRHVGASNPTYRNGKAIERNAPVQLVDGDEISFAPDLKARIRFR